ncbi:hypothetical protein BN2537_5211 [Streptomyces venezuelae]|nr:hypothetical protein BN2537_5211 [Streptomyces venezuelae]
MGRERPGGVSPTRTADRRRAASALTLEGGSGVAMSIPDNDTPATTPDRRMPHPLPRA